MSLKLTYKCDQPLSIVNRRYSSSKWPEDTAVASMRPDYYLYVPCGHCYTCRLRRAREWHVRLYHEALNTRKINVRGLGKIPRIFFLTFTFRDSDLPEFNSKNQRAVLAPFVKSWREAWRYRFGKSPRYFATTDLGTDNNRLHLHLLLFDPVDCYGNPIPKKDFFVANSDDPNEQAMWSFGFCTYCKLLKGLQGVHYVCGYMTGENTFKKAIKARDAGKPIYKHGKPLQAAALQHFASIFVSQGLGKSFVDSKDFEPIRASKSYLIHVGRFKYATPRYYRRFFFRDEWFADVDEDTGEILSMICLTADEQQRAHSARRVEEVYQMYIDDPPDCVYMNGKKVMFKDLPKVRERLLRAYTNPSLLHKPLDRSVDFSDNYFFNKQLSFYESISKQPYGCA